MSASDCAAPQHVQRLAVPAERLVKLSRRGGKGCQRAFGFGLMQLPSVCNMSCTL